MLPRVRGRRVLIEPTLMELRFADTELAGYAGRAELDEGARLRQ